MSEPAALIAVVIPCYRVTAHVGGVIAAVGPEVQRIYCVDDACPDGSGNWIEANIDDPRCRVLRNAINEGVGGAVMHGYRQAVADGARVIVKIDGDGQMDPALVPVFVKPILDGRADYTKGNRFWDFSELGNMPSIRIFGNAVLSFLSKLSTGYWNIFDPTNGYTAIDARVAAVLPHAKISKRYFFETDMLFRLGSARAVVMDIPMHARYGSEVSGLRVSGIIGEFIAKHAINSGKRIGYTYFVRQLSPATLYLVCGLLFLLTGTALGVAKWLHSLGTGVANPPGVVMLPALLLIIGVQLLIAFLAHDAGSEPMQPAAERLEGLNLKLHRASALGREESHDP